MRWKGARRDNEIWKNYCSAEQEAMAIYGLLFISCLRVQVGKSRFASLCLALEVRVENYTFRMEGFFFLSHSVIVKVNSDDKRSQGASHNCHNTAVGFADLKLSRWWHNLGSESNYFQQSGSHPGYRGRETCCILTFPRLGAPGSELGCKKIWTENCTNKALNGFGWKPSRILPLQNFM